MKVGILVVDKSVTKPHFPQDLVYLTIADVPVDLDLKQRIKVLDLN